MVSSSFYFSEASMNLNYLWTVSLVVSVNYERPLEYSLINSHQTDLLSSRLLYVWWKYVANIIWSSPDSRLELHENLIIDETVKRNTYSFFFFSSDDSWKIASFVLASLLIVIFGTRRVCFALWFIAICKTLSVTSSLKCWWRKEQETNFKVDLICKQGSVNFPAFKFRWTFLLLIYSITKCDRLGKQRSRRWRWRWNEKKEECKTYFTSFTSRG